ERETGIHFDADAAAGRRIVSPFGDDENLLADLHRLQMLAREGHPVAQIGGANLAAEALPEFGLEFIVIEEGAELRPVVVFLEFDDAGGTGVPQLRDDDVLLVLPASQVD